MKWAWFVWCEFFVGCLGFCQIWSLQGVLKIRHLDVLRARKIRANIAQILGLVMNLDYVTIFVRFSRCFNAKRPWNFKRKKCKIFCFWAKINIFREGSLSCSRCSPQNFWAAAALISWSLSVLGDSSLKPKTSVYGTPLSQTFVVARFNLILDAIRISKEQFWKFSELFDLRLRSPKK